MTVAQRRRALSGESDGGRAPEAAGGTTLALALLVGGCVFAAMAGPALSLHTRTQALHQTLAELTSTTKTVQVSADWGDFTSRAAPTTARHR